MKTVRYIPLRYVLAILISLFEILAIIGVVVLLCYHFPYLYLLAVLVQFFCALKIISSDDNPDYKVPWLVVVMGLPVAGFMLYFMFSQRKLKTKYIKRLKNICKNSYYKDDNDEFDSLKKQDITAFNQFKMLSKISGAHLFTDTKTEYFGDINDLNEKLILDLKNAKKFIFLEFFIIENGEFFDEILKILLQKAREGLDVRIVYDDIGSMKTLPKNFCKKLRRSNIKAVSFSRLKGGVDSEFNNRNHRKMIVIDGSIAYTGGFNLADEYVNKIQRFGHWKDAGIRLNGEAVSELIKLFLIDFGMNYKGEVSFKKEMYPKPLKCRNCGFIMPFGDGPKPLYKRNVSKSVIQNLLSSATSYVYITTPYLIIDNDLLTDIENASLRGVKIKIALPKIPDKKLVNLITKSYYNRLLLVGVEIVEYTPGFLHAKTYIVDGKYALLGTVNLDYRSLIHHFENAVLFYNSPVITDVLIDVENTFKSCESVNLKDVNGKVLRRLFSSLLRFFAPLM